MDFGGLAHLHELGGRHNDCWQEKAVMRAKEQLKRHFTLDEQGELREYVGCKIKRSLADRWMKLTQAVMIQSFTDEFDLPTEQRRFQQELEKCFPKMMVFQLERKKPQNIEVVSENTPYDEMEQTRYSQSDQSIVALHVQPYQCSHQSFISSDELREAECNLWELYPVEYYVGRNHQIFSAYHHGTQRF
jgi:hypothetical protein